MIHRTRTMSLSTCAAIAVAVMPGCGDAQTSSAAVRSPSTMTAVAVDSASICRVADAGRALPEAVRETSGLARGIRDSSRFWTHNDSGDEPVIYAIDAGGRLLQSIRVAGAAATDWEDIESGPCDGGSCLFIADIGDNERKRKTIDVYRVPEPRAGSAAAVNAVKLTMQFPDAAQDAEAIFLLPSGELYVVTKGRHSTIALYAMGAANGGAGMVTLRKVRELFPQPTNERDRVTAATSSPDGGWVGVRTYRTMYLYRADALVGNSDATPITVDLVPLAEVQGESLAIANDGTVWMTSEAEDLRMLPTWSRM